jgi:type III secretion protein T
MAADTPEQVLGLMDSVLRAGFLFASPLVGAMVLAELSLALVGRFAPQLNVFDLSMAVKGLVFVVGLPLYAAVLIGYLRDGLKPLAGMGEVLRRLGSS